MQNQKKKSLEIIRDASMSIVPRDWIEIWGWRGWGDKRYEQERERENEKKRGGGCRRLMRFVRFYQRHEIVFVTSLSHPISPQFFVVKLRVEGEKLRRHLDSIVQAKQKNYKQFFFSLLFFIKKNQSEFTNAHTLIIIYTFDFFLHCETLLCVADGRMLLFLLKNKFFSFFLFFFFDPRWNDSISRILGGKCKKTNFFPTRKNKTKQRRFYKVPLRPGGRPETKK